MSYVISLVCCEPVSHDGSKFHQQEMAIQGGIFKSKCQVVK